MTKLADLAKGLDNYITEWQMINILLKGDYIKHTNFDEVTDKKIASIQKKINNKPKKKIKVWNTQSRVLQKTV